MAESRNKLRRGRSYGEGRGIRSRLPTKGAPQSRVVTARQTPQHPEVLHPDGPLELSAALDRIVCGDSAQVLSQLPAAFVTCAITSPPYWNLVDYGVDGQIGAGTYLDYRDRLGAVWEQVARCLRPNGKLCLNVPLLPIPKKVSREHFGPTHTRMILDLYADLKADILARTDLRFYGLFIWEKQTTEKMFGSYPYPPNLLERNTSEFIAVMVKPGKPRKVPPQVKEAARLSQDEWMELTKQIWWMYPANVRRAEGHPAPFPEALPNRLINMYTFPGLDDQPGDVVLDPFAGWGTTCVAAERLGRRYLGIDLSPDFCAEAARRLEGVSRERIVMRAERPGSA